MSEERGDRFVTDRVRTSVHHFDNVEFGPLDAVEIQGRIAWAKRYRDRVASRGRNTPRALPVLDPAPALAYVPSSTRRPTAAMHAILVVPERTATMA